MHYNQKPHVIEDVNEVDDKGNKILDSNGKQIVTKGLKTQLLTKVDNIAYDILKPSDWMTTRQIETGVTIADDWKTWRASVRTQAKAMKTAINAVTTITDVPDLYGAYTTSSEGKMVSASTGFIGHWPKNPDEA